MNDEFSRTLEKKMQYFNTNPNADKINAVRSQIDDVKNTMVTNIEKVLERGEKIELLVDKTETLNQQAFAFKKKATHLKRLMWWQNFKLQLIIFLIVAVVIFIITLVACGGFTFPKCKSKKSDNKPKPQASQTPEPNHNKTATYQLLSAVLDHI
jgi:vesicle-associated membrane protein 7